MFDACRSAHVHGATYERSHVALHRLRGARYNARSVALVADPEPHALARMSLRIGARCDRDRCSVAPWRSSRATHTVLIVAPRIWVGRHAAATWAARRLCLLSGELSRRADGGRRRPQPSVIARGDTPVASVSGTPNRWPPRCDRSGGGPRFGEPCSTCWGSTRKRERWLRDVESAPRARAPRYDWSRWLRFAGAPPASSPLRRSHP